MCDPGEPVSLTLKREFMEEAANSTEKNENAKEIIAKKLDAIFSKGAVIYQGYVDDLRNTDNAWMETQCYNFHDDHGELLADFKLEAG
jgi:ADP-ribose pyrophosphatase